MNGYGNFNTVDVNRVARFCITWTGYGVAKCCITWTGMEC
jgi:hypothetical protein